MTAGGRVQARSAAAATAVGPAGVAVAPPEHPYDVALDERSLRLIDGRRVGRIRRRGWLVRRALVTADVLGLVAAFTLAALAFGHDPAEPGEVGRGLEVVGFALTLPAWVALAQVFGLYARDEERADHSTVDDLGGVFTVVTTGSWLLIVGALATGLATPYVPKLAAFWVLAIALVTATRAAARMLSRRRLTYTQNTVIVGAGDVGQLIASKLQRHPEYGINLLGFVDAGPARRRKDLRQLRVVGGPAQLVSIVRDLQVERVIVAFSNERRDELVDDLRALRSLDVQVDVVPRFFDLVGPGAGLHAVEGLPLVSLPPARLPATSLFLKRALDVVGSAVGLILLSPVFAVIAYKLKRDSPGPVFYRHQRLGKGGTPIEVLKFRTMRREFCRGARYGGELAERKFAEMLDDPARAAEFKEAFKLQEDPRVTRFGAILRRTSLDELPQLVNVLRGDLSLVGPRPIVRDEVDRYGAGVNELLNVKPGITGLWQINGRSDLDYDDRVRLDLAYVGDWSLGLDITILGKTIRTVLAGDGAR